MNPDTILYGASFYPEYMPYERLDRDIELIKNANINFVRMGESTWSVWEPEDGRFEPEWMDVALDKLHQAGIRVVLGTPTYSIPPWLFRKHPEVVRINRDGRREGFGYRQIQDMGEPVYRKYCERIIRWIVSRYAGHPAVIGWQLDNETCTFSGSFGPRVEADFLERLKKKFGTPEALNKAWGLNYWSRTLSCWEDFTDREQTVSTGHRLEWDRHQRDMTLDFLAWQAQIVRELKGDHQFVTHDFAGSYGMQSVDEEKVAEHLDIAGTNPYEAPNENLTGNAMIMACDHSHSLKRSNFFVLETCAQSMGHGNAGRQEPPFPGQLALQAYTLLSSGADMVTYWHWHSLHYGVETYWKGVLSHDLEPNRVYGEVQSLASEFRRFGHRLVGLQKKNRVAILHSLDSLQAISHLPFSKDVTYFTVLQQVHKSLSALQVECDFVFPHTEDLERYDFVVVPPLYIADDALLERLAVYARNGGHLYLFFKSGFCNEHATVRACRQPGGPLREAAGVWYQEFVTPPRPVALRNDPLEAGDSNQVTAWLELLMPEGADVVASYEHPFYGNYAAITVNQYGKGSVTYQGCNLTDPAQRRSLRNALVLAGIPVDETMPSAVRLRTGTNRDGKQVVYCLNFSYGPVTIPSPLSGDELRSGEPFTAGSPLTLPAWGCAVIAEA